jgi:antitoxin component YwqK of YwqJK toxin-antitoxin module
MKNFKFNGKLYGINIRYFLSGRIIKFKCYYINYKKNEIKSVNKFIFISYNKMKNFKFNNKREGKYIEYHDNGNIYMNCNYKNDKREGKYISYRENGKIWFKYYYKNDEREGEYIYYDRNGNINKRCYYKKDKLDGEYILYYKNGNICNKYYYKNDNLEGELNIVTMKTINFIKYIL